MTAAFDDVAKSKAKQKVLTEKDSLHNFITILQNKKRILNLFRLIFSVDVSIFK
jgi:hypothetical protein